VQVVLAASGRTLDVPRGQSLLSALEDAVLKPASGCRMGICNTCACGKRAGTTHFSFAPMSCTVCDCVMPRTSFMASIRIPLPRFSKKAVNALEKFKDCGGRG
jgi:hypothetical protein